MADVTQAVRKEFTSKLEQYADALMSALKRRFKLNKLAKAGKRHPHLPLDRASNVAAERRYQQAVANGLATLRQSVARQVKTKLPDARKLLKQDPNDFSPDEWDWATAEAIAAGLDMSELSIIVDATKELGASVAGESARLAIGQLGFNDNSEIVNLVDQRAVDWATERAAELVSISGNASIVSSTRNMVRDIVARGLAGGLTKDEIAEEITDQDAYPFSEERAELIARTEIARAHSQGALTGYRTARDEMGINVKKEWLITDEACDDCQDNEDAGPIDLDDDFPSGDDAPPAHPNCFPGSTLVTPIGGIAAVSERVFKGQVVVIRTASGNELTCTPNHPVLTPSGFRPALSLDEGSYVISGHLRDWAVDHDHMPATIEHVAKTLQLANGVTTASIPIAPEDFHGDGKGSEVAIVRTNGLLGDGVDASVLEQLRKLALVFADAQSTMLPGQRALNQLLLRAFPATDSVMRASGMLKSLSPGHALHPERIGFADSSDGNVPLLQAPIDGFPGYLELLRELLNRLSFEVALDKVVEVNVRSFDSHVYNLQTATGLLIAQGIITSNCRCALTSVTEE